MNDATEDFQFRCRVCEEWVQLPVEAPVRLRVRWMASTPKVCAECRAHLVSIHNQILAADTTPTKWALENAKPTMPEPSYRLAEYGRREGARVECPFCLHTGSHGFGFLMPNGLHMHLDRCFVMQWMDSEEIERTRRRARQENQAHDRRNAKAPVGTVCADAADHLYLIANKRARLVKIGVSNNPQYRIRQLQNTNGESLTLVAAIQLEDAYAVEGRLHHWLSRFRQRGEWFTDTPQVREAFFGVRANAQAA